MRTDNLGLELLLAEGITPSKSLTPIQVVIAVDTPSILW